MGQEFHVLRCFSCRTFQVHQVKKSKKWNCKMCGEKQSLMKVYGRGSGADCRNHVQKLNSLRGEVLQAEVQLASSPWKQEADEEEENVEELKASGGQLVAEAKASRWSKYLDKEDGNMAEEELQEEESFCSERDALHAHSPIDRRNARKQNGGQSSVLRKRPYSEYTEAHCSQKRTKRQKFLQKETTEPYSSRGLSWMALAKNKDGSVTDATREPCSVAICSSTGRHSAVNETSAAKESTPAVSSERAVEESTSRWTRFMSVPFDSEGGVQGDPWPMDARQTAADGDVTRLGQSKAGMGPPVYEYALSMRTAHTSVYSLFQTDEDFDNAF